MSVTSLADPLGYSEDGGDALTRRANQQSKKQAKLTKTAE